MKPLFALGACLATAVLAGAASAQFPAPQSGAPYWATTGPGTAIGTGVTAQPSTYRYQRDDPMPNVPRPPQPPVVRPPVVQPPVVQPPAVQPPAVQPPHAHPHMNQPAPYGHGGPQMQMQPSHAPHTQSHQLPPGMPHAGTWTPNGVGANGSAFDVNGYACEQPSYGIKRAHRGGWFGSASAMFMTRDNANNVWLSVDDGNITDKVMTAHDAEMDYGTGGEITIGRYYCNNTRAWQFTYWGIFPDRQEHSVRAGVDTVGNLGTSRTFDGLQYAGGNVVDFYNDEDLHRLRRNYEFHNVELNIMGAPGYAAPATCCAPFGDVGGNCGACKTGPSSCGACGGRGCPSCVTSCDWRFNWLAGFRYFQFREDFLYSSDVADNVFNGAPEEIHYEIDLENHLIGFQVGGIADYCWSSRWNFRNSIKVGAYASYINHRSRIYGSAGTATISNINSPYNGADWLVNSDKDDIAFMAEWDTAVTYQWNCNWRARMGYRAVAITGVALVGEQIPTETYVDLGNVRIIDSNGSMILHGGYASLEYSY